MPLHLDQIDKSWTLFLDRDGVINHELAGDYIRNREGFSFYDLAPENIRLFKKIFYKVIVVTNQRGVSKGLMTEDDLLDIHGHMQRHLSTLDAPVDAIYYCLGGNESPCRKPNPGMALQARDDFPAIDFARSIMVGNNLSDMEFARNAGMHAVFLRTTSPEQPTPHAFIDLDFINLNAFAQALKKAEL